MKGVCSFAPGDDLLDITIRLENLLQILDRHGVNLIENRDQQNCTGHFLLFMLRWMMRGRVHAGVAIGMGTAVRVSAAAAVAPRASGLVVRGGRGVLVDFLSRGVLKVYCFAANGRRISVKGLNRACGFFQTSHLHGMCVCVCGDRGMRRSNIVSSMHYVHLLSNMHRGI